MLSLLLRSFNEGDLICLRRDSDNAELDFTYDANGDLDTDAIATWLSSATGYIVRVYAQDGSVDMVQPTALLQPQYVASRIPASRSKTQIINAPGTKLMQSVRFVYSAKHVERVFDPIYADFCEEYFAALAAGEKWHARWIWVRYYKDFAKAVGLFGVVRLAKTAFEYWEKIA